MPLLERFRRDLDRLGLRPLLEGRDVVAAVSGGADSLCLLHLLARLSSTLGMRLHAATLDHGLRGEAGAADADFVAATARAWGLPVHRNRIDAEAIAQARGYSIEMAARLARYAFLARVAREVGAAVIATGHNADDQAETILMHVIRGSGLAGLRGMRPIASLSAAHLLPGSPSPDGLVLIRPLLSIPRTEIDAYCAAHDLHPRHDATNDDPAYFRNRVRHDVLPRLAALNPNVRNQLARMGETLAADYEELQNQVGAAFTGALLSLHEDTIWLDREQFRRLSPSLRRGVLRDALRRLEPRLQDVGLAALDQAVEVAARDSGGGQAVLPGGIVLRAGYGDLILSRPGAAQPLPDIPRMPADLVLGVRVPGSTPLPDSGWTLSTRWLNSAENPADFYGQPLTAVLDVPEDAVLALRTRRRGDRFSPQGMGGRTQKLSDTLINMKVPAPLRDGLPLLTVNGEIAWIAWGEQNRIAEPFAVHAASKRRVLAVWSYRALL